MLKCFVIRNFRDTYSSIKMLKGYMVRERLGTPGVIHFVAIFSDVFSLSMAACNMLQKSDVKPGWEVVFLTKFSHFISDWERKLCEVRYVSRNVLIM